MLNFESNSQKNTQLFIYELISGSTDENTEFWIYLEIPVERYTDFLEAQAKGELILKEFGNPIAWGEGSEPSADEMLDIEKAFQLDHSLQEKLREAVQLNPSLLEYAA